jgi:predicted Zn-dependent protease
VDAYRSYAKLVPGDPNPYYGLAASLVALGRPGEALVAYDAFLARSAAQPRLAAWRQRAERERRELAVKVEREGLEQGVAAAVAAARKAAADGKPAEVEKGLRAALTRFPRAVALVDILVNLLIRQNRCGEALPILKETLAASAPYPGGAYRYALCLRLGGDHRAAEDWYRKALKAAPQDPDVHYGLAETLRLLGRRKEALAVYQRYVALEQRPEEQPFVAKARERITELQAGAEPERPVAAAPPGPAAGSIDPRVQAMLEARRRFEERQREAEAEAPARPATRQGPRPVAREPAGPDPRRAAADEARARREAARLEAEAARRAAAEEARRKREEAARQRAEAARQKAAAAQQAAARRKAERTADQVLAGKERTVEPAVREVLVARAEADEQQGKLPAALRIWQRLAELDPGDLAAAEGLARVGEKAGDARAAVAGLRALIQAKPKQVALYARLRAAEAKAGLPLTALPIHLLLPAEVIAARAALRSGRPADALAQADARLRTNASDAYAHVVRAEALLALGRVPEARVSADRASALGPKLAGPARVLGHCLLKVRDRSAALAQYQLFLARLAVDPTELPYADEVRALVTRLEE